MMSQPTLFQDAELQELIACNLLRSVAGLSLDAAEALVQRFGGVYQLAQVPQSALMTLPGIGPKRAAKIRALTEWALLLQAAQLVPHLQIRQPTDIANFLMLEMSVLEREELRVVTLNTKNYVQTVDTIYKGSLNSCLVRPAEVFRTAIFNNSASIILTHNHPSGADPTPSPEDVRCTEMIVAAGRSLDIEVLDHIIFSQNRFCSLKERGLGF